MAFTIEVPKSDHESPVGALVADRRLYVAADETTLVEAGSPKAAFLLAPAGQMISAGTVARLRLALVDGRVVQRTSTPDEQVVEQKEQIAAEDKMRAASATKGKK